MTLSWRPPSFTDIASRLKSDPAGAGRELDQAIQVLYKLAAQSATASVASSATPTAPATATTVTNITQISAATGGNATLINGAPVPLSTPVLASDSSGRIIAATLTAGAGATFDGGTSAPTLGKWRVWAVGGFTITGSKIFARAGETTGSATVVVRHCTNAAFPTMTDIGTLTLSSEEKSDNDITAGTIADGDWIEFELTSASGLTMVVAQILGTRG